jgi:hypothetical protein
MRQNGRRESVDAFVQRHFTWPGTLRLHGAALGLDILRAPVNVMLSPILVLARIAAWICRKLHLARAADWLMARRLLLRTAVSARVEAAILHELLEVPLSTDQEIPDRASRNLDAHPQVYWFFDSLLGFATRLLGIVRVPRQDSVNRRQDSTFHGDKIPRD